MKVVILVVVCCLLAIVFGFQLGTSNYIFTSVVLGVVVLYVLKILFARGVRIEACAALVLIIGYFFGGKSFAYMGVGSIYIGEVGLAFCLFVFVCRMIFEKKGRFFPKNPLLGFMLVFLAYGFLHLLKGYRIYGLDAAKDCAVVYYSLFFFIGYAQLNSEKTVKYLLKVIPFAAIVSSLIYAISVGSGKFMELVELTTVGGFPIIAQMIDTAVPMTIASSCCLYILFSKKESIQKVFFGVLAFMVLIPVVLSSKAIGYLALFLTFLYMFFINKRGYILTFVFVAMIGAIFAIVYYTIYSDEYKGSRFESGLLEFTSFKVTSEEKTDTLGEQTVNWRLFWWKKIVRDTINESPFLGQGFGVDITTEFIEDFYQVKIDPNRNNRSDARYPHSIIFTIFGRLGLLGLVMFLSILIMFCLEIKKSILYFSLVEDKASYVFLWVYIFCGLTNSLFQATFEPPYAAIPFWIIMGIAYRMNEQIRLELAEKKALIEQTTQVDGIQPLAA